MAGVLGTKGSGGSLFAVGLLMVCEFAFELLLEGFHSELKS